MKENSLKIYFWEIVVIMIFLYCKSLNALTWPVSATGITSTHGEFRSLSRLHTGVDINSPGGSNVYACISGTAYRIGGADDPGGFGITIDYIYYYWHLEETTRVPNNSYVVEESSIIGKSSNTGPAGTPYHLHFRTGDWNPLIYFAYETAEENNGVFEGLYFKQSDTYTPISNNQTLRLTGGGEFIVRAHDESNIWCDVSFYQTDSRLYKNGSYITGEWWCFDYITGTNPTSPRGDEVYSVSNPASSYSPPKYYYRTGSWTPNDGNYTFTIYGYDMIWNSWQQQGIARLCLNQSINFIIDTTPPLFTVEYFYDSGFTQPLPTYIGDPVTKAGIIYLRITSNETLSSNPTFDIALLGLYDQSTSLVSGNAYRGSVNISSTYNDYAYITVTGSDLVGNTATDVYPTTGYRFIIDNTPPAIISFSITDASTWRSDWSSGYVNVHSDVLDNLTTVTQMKLINENGTTSDWTTFFSLRTWMLSAGNGNKTVYAQFKDTAGNISTTVSDTINCDWTKPEITPTSDPSDPQYKAQATSPVGKYSTSTTIPFDWREDFATDPESGIWDFYLEVTRDDGFIHFGANVGYVTSYNVSNCEHSRSYQARVRARNNAGLYSDWGAYSEWVKVDLTPPDKQFIDDGTYTNNNTQLSCSWVFSDLESCVTQYWYGIGTAQYPDSGWDSVAGMTFVSTNTSVTHTGLNLSDGTYYWTIKARNGAGLETISSSDGIIVDTVPPDAPIDLSANPSGWTNQTQFELCWTDPADLSGIKGAYYKLHSPPTSNTDYLGYSDGNPITVDISGLIEGENTLYVWLKDNAENTDYNNYSTVILRYDITAPEISNYSAPGLSPNGDGINEITRITFKVADILSDTLRTTLKIYNQSGNEINILLTDIQTLNPHIFSVLWDGRDNSGNIVPEGRYRVKITATDEATNSKVYEDDVVVDLSPPVVSNTSVSINPGGHTSPVDTFTTNDNSVDIIFALYDKFSSSVTVSFRYIRDDTTIATRQVAFGLVPDTTQTCTYKWDGKDDFGFYAGDGLHGLTLDASDLAGNRTEPMTLSDAFRIDFTPSYVQTIYTDRVIFYDAEQVGLFYEVTDTAAVEVNVLDGAGKTLNTYNLAVERYPEQLYSFVWDGKDSAGNYVSDGSYILQVKTTDDVGNESSRSVGVIKNYIPARISFPADDYAVVSGTVIIRGDALDPGTDNPRDFMWYKLWYSTFEVTEISDPKVPTVGIWYPVVVPAINQSPADPNFPDSNISYRAVTQDVLGCWMTGDLPAETVCTLLLVTEDKSGNVSYATRKVTIGVTAASESTPAVSITSPVENDTFTLNTETATLKVEYQVGSGGAGTGVSLEIFRLTNGNYAGLVRYESVTVPYSSEPPGHDLGLGRQGLQNTAC